MATAVHVRTSFWFATLFAVLFSIPPSGRAQNPVQEPLQKPVQDPVPLEARPAEVPQAQLVSAPIGASAIPAASPAALPTASTSARPLTPREARDQARMMEEAAEAVRINRLARINGVPYDQPSAGDTFRAYARDTYGWPAGISTTVRALYSQARGKPEGWDFPERFGSSAGITIINGNVRYGLGALFHEDLRYLPCPRCSAKLKLENALLAEITARHSDDGHRFFTLTPTIADFSGPIIAHATWYPTFDPLQGVISARLVFATRIGGHLFQEFVMDKVHPALRPQN